MITLMQRRVNTKESVLNDDKVREDSSYLTKIMNITNGLFGSIIRDRTYLSKFDAISKSRYLRIWINNTWIHFSNKSRNRQ